MNPETDLQSDPVVQQHTPSVEDDCCSETKKVMQHIGCYIPIDKDSPIYCSKCNKKMYL